MDIFYFLPYKPDNVEEFTNIKIITKQKKTVVTSIYS